MSSDTYNAAPNVYFPECPVCHAPVEQAHDPVCPLDRLLTHVQARKEAQRLRAAGLPAIAQSIPAGAWGGTEKGWTVKVVWE